MSVWDIPLDDPAAGPELSVRSMGVLTRNGAKTVGDMRDMHANGTLKKLKGLGVKSFKEIREAVDHYTRLENPQDLFDDPEYRRYKLEESLHTAQALMHDVQNGMLRAALKGAVSADTRKQMSLKLRDAAERIMQLPIYGD